MAFRDRSMTGTRVLDVAMAGLALAVYVLVAIQSPGLDDEFFNIRGYLAAERSESWRAFFDYASRDPVHPTGSYLLSFALRGLLGSWELVRAVKSAAVFLLAWLLLGRLFPSLRWKGLDLRPLVLLSPSLLLWCTGLRWFGEATVLVLAAAAADRLVDRRRWSFFPFLGLIVLAMIHVSYIGLVLGPVLLAFHLLRHPSLRTQTWPLAASLLLLALGSALPLTEVLNSTRTDQTGSLLRSTAGTLHGVLVNHGIFPLSAAGVVTLLATATLFALLLALRPRELFRSSCGRLSIALLLALALSGLGVKFRNVTPVLPLLYGTAFALALSSRPGERPAFRHLLQGSLLLFLATSLYGLVNVLSHERTAKGSWNLPVAETVQTVKGLTDRCENALVVVWDPVLQYHLWNAGIDTADLGYDGGEPARDPAALRSTDCLFIVWTNRGTSGEAEFFSASTLDLTTLAEIAADEDHAAKARVDPLIPEYYVTIHSLDPLAASHEAGLFTESFYDRLNR